MPRIVTVHSFRRGAGRSSLVANLAALLAQDGQRIGVLDSDLQSPSQHILFKIDEAALPYTFNDYLRGRCDIEQAVCDVSAQAGVSRGQVYLTPADAGAIEIARVSREGFDLDVFEQGCQALLESFRLDTLLIDCHAGLSEETLVAIAIADLLLVMLRPDQRDFDGTGVTVQVARKLEVPWIELVINEVPLAINRDTLKAQAEQIYRCDVAGILYHDNAVLALGGDALFVTHCPDCPLSIELGRIARRITRR